MENVQLTIADIASIRGLLEASCARGTWKASEMSKVGQLYDKLTDFLNQTPPPPAQQPQGE